MLIFAFIIGIAIALLIKRYVLESAEYYVKEPGNFWHYVHIGINLAFGFTAIFLFWSWIVGAIGLGLLAVGIASIWTLI